jgi:hypothetical protein
MISLSAGVLLAYISKTKLKADSNLGFERTSIHHFSSIYRSD